MLRVMECSRISIVILSETYVFSTWCMTELCKIVEHMHASRLIVIPVFYHVNASDLRRQRGLYEDVFNQYESWFDLESVRTWRTALTEVCSLSGWHLGETNVEAHFIQDIIQDVSRKLNRPSKNFSEDQSEIDSLVVKNENNPTIGKASFSSDPYSSEMLVPSYDNLSDESFPDEDSKTTAFTLLERHFQDPYGATSSFNIVVPGTEIPPWFTNQSLGGSVSLKINPNWCDSNWMGLALAVCFRANPSNILYCDMKLDNNDWKVKTMDYDYATMGNPDQIWVFYCLRLEWPTKELLHSYFNLYFSFHPKVPFRNNFGPCGVRLVYKKDIEELNQFSSSYFNDLSHQEGGYPPVPKRDSTDGGHFKEHLRFRRRSF